MHVSDIAAGVVAAIERDAAPGAYNLADDLPSSQNSVIEEACRTAWPSRAAAAITDEAGLSRMARGFYAENRRVANGKAKRVLGWQPRYTYRDPALRVGVARRGGAVARPRMATTIPTSVTAAPTIGSGQRIE